MQSRNPIGVRPAYPARSPRHLERASWAVVLAAIGNPGGRDPVAVARNLWPDDEVPPLLLRSAVAGATTSAPGWAKELCATGLADFVAGLGPQSAMAEIIRRGITVPIGDFASVTVPHRVSVAAGGWVGEGAPIPAAAFPLSPLTLTPKKAGWVITTTRELLRVVGGGQVFTQTLREVAGATVDSLYLGSAAASSAGLAGLLDGVIPLVSAGDPLGDLGQLAEAVGGTTGSGEVIYVASPGLAAHLAQLNNHKAMVLASVVVPTGRLIAIDPQAILHGINPEVSIDANEEAVLHLSDSPAQIGSTGPVVAAPSASMYQTGQVVFRCLADLSWVKRSPTCVAYIDAVAWA